MAKAKKEPGEQLDFFQIIPRPAPAPPKQIVVKPLARDPYVERLIEAGAPVAIAVSGGADSCAMAIAVVKYLRERGFKGRIVLVFTDLGRIEWKGTLEIIELLASRLDVELFVARNPNGDLIDRWYRRFAANRKRYAELLHAKLVMPWSSSKMKFCQSDEKLAPKFKKLIELFRGCEIVSVVGIRRDESDQRADALVCEDEPKLKRAAARDDSYGPTCGVNWHPIIEWTKEEVFFFLESEGFPLHDSYSVYLSPRHSCSFCILASLAAWEAAARCETNIEAFRLLVDLEILSGFPMKQKKWLADTKPEWLTVQQRRDLPEAKKRAARRIEAEKRIPKHLLPKNNKWPRAIPSYSEAVLLCEVRAEVADTAGIRLEYNTPEAMIARFKELMEERHAREARSAKRKERQEAKKKAAPEREAPARPGRRRNRFAVSRQEEIEFEKAAA